MTLTQRIEKIKRDHDEAETFAVCTTMDTYDEFVTIDKAKIRHEPLVKALEIAIKYMDAIVKEPGEAAQKRLQAVANEKIEAVLKGCWE